MNSLNKAIMLNNEGAHLLSSGQAMEALHLMQSAVLTLKDFTPPSAGSHRPSVIAVPLCPFPTKDMEPERNLPHIDGLLYRYERPLLIPTLVNESEVEFASVVETLSTYVIFNFALACHQFGKQTGTDAPLQRAMELYDLFIRTLNRLRSECDCQHYESLQCLALNNLAHLHYDYCDYEESQYCMNCMHEILNESSDCLESSNCLSTLETEEIMLNHMYLQRPTAARAA
jgi:hypothetical protein